ncbi:unknown [Acinetobacter sp. CAG:196]|nr:unknown [Acinetobacter sp. CAG:196]
MRKYSRTSEYYLITTPLKYLSKDESAYINGIIIPE